LALIEQRNEKRRQLKAATSKGPWCYDSYGCVMPPAGTLIVVRRTDWWDRLSDRYGQARPAENVTGMLDEHLDYNDLQPYHDAEWIAETHEDLVADDVDTLIREVRRLRDQQAVTVSR
jgi:hypothetical protein